MPRMHFGSCLCGTVRFQIEGDFQHFFLCHCGRCREDTGSAHAANLFSSVATLTWVCGRDRVGCFTLPGTRHTRCFCSMCGSALPSLQMEGSLLAVPAGSLDGDIAVKPDAHIFGSSRANWDDALGEIPMIEGSPP